MRGGCSFKDSTPARLKRGEITRRETTGVVDEWVGGYRTFLDKDLEAAGAVMATEAVPGAPNLS